MKNVPIAYPFARNADGNSVPIAGAKHDMVYTCVGCGKPMIPKLGSIKRHHFSHKTNESCDADTALHESAKIYIAGKFDKAIQSNDAYIIPVPCSCCKQAIGYNLTAGGVKIKQEEGVVEKTRSDLVVLKSNSSAHTIIEIVVTHDLESYTKEAYSKSGISVIRIRPTWDKMDIAASTINIMCEGCLIRESDLKWLMSNIPRSRGALREITHDKFNSPLFPAIRSTVNKHARALYNFGFAQQSRSTLFMYETGYWQVYADLDSTDIMRIWEVNGEPALYAFTKRGLEEVDCHPDCRECVLVKARESLLALGVPTRRYFYDAIHHSHTHY